MDDCILHDRLQDELYDLKFQQLPVQVCLQRKLIPISAVINVNIAVNIVQLVLQCNQLSAAAHAVFEHRRQRVNTRDDIVCLSDDRHPADCIERIEQEMRIDLCAQRLILVLFPCLTLCLLLFKQRTNRIRHLPERAVQPSNLIFARKVQPCDAFFHLIGEHFLRKRYNGARQYVRDPNQHACQHQHADDQQRIDLCLQPCHIARQHGIARQMQNLQYFSIKRKLPRKRVIGQQFLSVGQRND